MNITKGWEMIHKISQMCDKVSVIYNKSMELRRMKYDTPKESRDENQINFLVQDIQALCREIANDTTTYTKTQERRYNMYKVMMSVFLAVGLLIAVTTGVANSNENTQLPEKKPFTLALKSKVNSVNDWLNSRPDAVNLSLIHI